MSRATLAMSGGWLKRFCAVGGSLSGRGESQENWLSSSQRERSTGARRHIRHCSRLFQKARVGPKRTICTGEAAERPAATSGSSVLRRFRRKQVLVPPGGVAADGNPLLWKTAVRKAVSETPNFDLGGEWMAVQHKDAQFSVEHYNTNDDGSTVCQD